MKQLSDSAIKRLAEKYVWWKTPDEMLAQPARVIAQVMNIGDYDDVQLLAEEVGEDVLCDVLANAESGQFTERSWAYWHYRLGLASPNQLPPMPVRKIA